MRTAAISALLLISLTAGCGDSGGGSKDDEGTMDAGGGGNQGNNGSPVDNNQEDDEDLDNACDYDPCCVGNQDYDFERCNGGMKDAGTMDSAVANDDASVVEDAGRDAGADAAVDAGKTE